MEREMRKLLLVAVSVGVFLLVTITVALVLTTPNAQRQEASLTSPLPFTNGRVQRDTSPDVQPTVTGITNGQPAIINIPEITVNVDNIKVDRETPEQTALADKNNGDSLTIQIPVPSAAVAVTPVASGSSAVAKPQTPAASSSTVTRGTQQQGTQRNAAQNTASNSTATANSQSSARTAVARTINDFWIQIGAYSAMVRAEDARELLASKGLISIIENREINGQNLFRVRLGPYTSEREANHWLAIVREIEEFNDSQVRQSVRQQ